MKALWEAYQLFFLYPIFGYLLILFGMLIHGGSLPVLGFSG